MTYDNPSAGKFDPLPPPRSEEDERARRKWRLIGLLLFLGSLATYWLQSFRGRGWVVIVGGIAAFVLAVAQFVAGRKRADEIDGQGPYSRPTSITH